MKAGNLGMLIWVLCLFPATLVQAISPGEEAQSEYMLADMLMQQGEFQAAIEHAEKERTVLGHSNPAIEHILASAYSKAGQYDQAWTALKSFFKLSPEAESGSEVYIEMVELYNQIDEVEKNKFDQFIKESEESLRLLLTEGMVAVPGGCFLMGDITGEGARNEDPVHEVCVDGFYMGKTEVTQGQWQAVMGTNPAKFQKGIDYPVERVSWDEAQQFISKLNVKTGKRYRLPTEAEWEYAASSGGRQEKYAGGADVDAVAWYGGNSDSTTHPVATKQPNGLGIYDMSGNVWELCRDWYDEGYYRSSPRDNPQGPSSGTARISRGGSWQYPAKVVRVGLRARSKQSNTNNDLGFRLVLANACTSTATTTLQTMPAGGMIQEEESGRALTALTGEFVKVPGGCFQMGDSFGEENADEKPVHDVCVDDFYLGRTEVTQGQWLAVMGTNPAKFQKGDDYPVEQVSWDDVQQFVSKLNTKSGKRYRLPSEAEWEYAARSGGRQEKYAGGASVEAVAWYESNSDFTTHPVASKQANGLGLYDMSGNVWEWCQDWYDEGYYRISSRHNPQGPPSGTSRIVRGGSWRYSAEIMRAAHRYKYEPSNRDTHLGFRLLLVE